MGSIAETLRNPWIIILRGSTVVLSQSVAFSHFFFLVALSIYFPSNFVLNDRVLTLCMNIQLPLIWSTWTRSRGGARTASGPHSGWHVPSHAWRMPLAVAWQWAVIIAILVI